jgi:hypothetical protein
MPLTRRVRTERRSSCLQFLRFLLEVFAAATDMAGAAEDDFWGATPVREGGSWGEPAVPPTRASEGERLYGYIRFSRLSGMSDVAEASCG